LIFLRVAKTVSGKLAEARHDISRAKSRFNARQADFLPEGSLLGKTSSDALDSRRGSGVELFETHSSAEQRFIQGELKRAKKPVSVRGLNRNHNHDLKNLFKGAATVVRPGRLGNFMMRWWPRESGRRWHA